MTPDKFFEECKKNGIGLTPNEQAKLRGLLRPGSGKLSKDMGASFEKASFFELACQIGDEVGAIAGWLDQKQQEQEAKELEKAKRQAVALKKEGTAPAETKSEEVPKKIQDTAAEEKIETAKAPATTAEIPAREPSAEAPQKKGRKLQSDFEYSSFFGQRAAANNESAKETRRKIATLKREKDYLSRNMAMYKRDFATLSTINKYGKYSGFSVSADGIDASGNMAQVIHAAVSLLVKEIKSNGDELLLKKIMEAQEAVTRETEEIDKKIEKLERQLYQQ